MRTLVGGQCLSFKLNGDTTFDREVGRCALGDGQHIGAIMIARALCGRCARYDPLRTYAAVQRKSGAFPGDYPAYCRWVW